MCCQGLGDDRAHLGTDCKVKCDNIRYIEEYYISENLIQQYIYHKSEE